MSRTIAAMERSPTRVVHLWTLDEKASRPTAARVGSRTSHWRRGHAGAGARACRAAGQAAAVGGDRRCRGPGRDAGLEQLGSPCRHDRLSAQSRQRAPGLPADAGRPRPGGDFSRVAARRDHRGRGRDGNRSAQRAAFRAPARAGRRECVADTPPPVGRKGAHAFFSRRDERAGSHREYDPRRGQPTRPASRRGGDRGARGRAEFPRRDGCDRAAAGGARRTSRPGSGWVTNAPASFRPSAKAWMRI